MPRRVLILGAGLAGSRCAQTLRAEGFDGEITLVGEELHPPYERPALSKEFLAGTRSELALQPPAYWEDNDIRLLLGTRVDRIEVAQKLAWTARSAIGWDALVLATGARPRRLPGLSGPGVHVLRTLADARSLRAHLIPGRRLVIAGAGFIGTEVASTALALGLEVTLVDKGRLPFEGTLGTEVGRFLAHRYRAHGVDLRPETLVTRLAATALVRCARSPSPTGPSSPATFSSSPPVPSPPESCSACRRASPPTRRGGRRFPASTPAETPPPPGIQHSLATSGSSTGRAPPTRPPPSPARSSGTRRALRPARTSGPTSSGFRLQHVGVPAGWTRVTRRRWRQSRSKRTTSAPTTASSPHCS